MRLTLLVPELIWPEPQDRLALGELRLPGLEWLLAHGECRKTPRRPLETVLTETFGLADPTGTAPFGPLRLLGESDGALDPHVALDPRAADDGHWLCADPVHLRFHHERIVLADAGAFDLDLAEAQALVAALNGEFAELGRFHAATARRWYLRLHAAVDHPAAPISAVAGKRVDGSSGQGLPLTRWQSEIQMFLHGHPINTAREMAGKPAVNSLWLWGGGTRPAAPSTPHPAFSAVFAHDPLARGLARACGLPQHPLPPDLSALDAATAGAHPLVVLDSLLPPVLYEDSAGWRQAGQALEAQWFAPLQARLGRAFGPVELIAPTIYGTLAWTLGHGERWKFWKKGEPLAALAERLAERRPA